MELKLQTFLTVTPAGSVWYRFTHRPHLPPYKGALNPRDKKLGGCITRLDLGGAKYQRPNPKHRGVVTNILASYPEVQDSSPVPQVG